MASPRHTSQRALTGAGPIAPMRTERLTLRPWRAGDAAAALEIYGHPDVDRRLSPAMARVPDLATMRALLRQWIADGTGLAAPAGRWAIERTRDGQVIGGAALLPLPPGEEDLGVSWQLTPAAAGDGHADEAMVALASWAFRHEVDELFAVVRPEDTPAAAVVRHNGKRWVGETTKYFGLELQVYRLRQADFDRGAPTTHRPPNHGRPSGAR